MLLPVYLCADILICCFLIIRSSCFLGFHLERDGPHYEEMVLADVSSRKYSRVFLVALLKALCGYNVSSPE